MKHYTRDQDLCRECGAPPGISCSDWASMEAKKRDEIEEALERAGTVGTVETSTRRVEVTEVAPGHIIAAAWDEPKELEDPWVEPAPLSFSVSTVVALAVASLAFGVAIPMTFEALTRPKPAPEKVRCSPGYVWTGAAYKLKPNGEIESPDPRGIWTDDRTELVFDVPGGVAVTCAKVAGPR